MKFIPNLSVREIMLEDMGFSREKLFSDVPANLMKKLSLSPPLSEIEVEEKMETLLAKNKKISSFLGAGCFPTIFPPSYPTFFPGVNFILHTHLIRQRFPRACSRHSSNTNHS